MMHENDRTALKDAVPHGKVGHDVLHSMWSNCKMTMTSMKARNSDPHQGSCASTGHGNQEFCAR